MCRLKSSKAILQLALPQIGLLALHFSAMGLLVELTDLALLLNDLLLLVDSELL